MKAPLTLSKIARQVDVPPPRAVDLVVIHCSATTSGQPLQQGRPGKPGYMNAAQVIDVWHAARGFCRALAAVRAYSPRLPAIGYHYVIDLDGTVWAGRALDEIPAQAAYFNDHTVGICLVGGAERQARYTPAQWASLAQVVSLLLADYGIPAAAPMRVASNSRMGYTLAQGVCGHRDLAPDKNGDGLIESFEWLKTCPGFDVAAWLKAGMRPDAKNIFPTKTAGAQA